jgi:hypothetical protein
LSSAPLQAAGYRVRERSGAPDPLDGPKNEGAAPHDGSSANEPRSEALLGAGEQARTAARIQAGGAEEGPG